MLDTTTELLSYSLFLFLAYVYLPYNLFKFGAERVIDLGRRRDFTQLEEIIAGFSPTFFLHLVTLGFYRLINWFNEVEYTIDFSVIASMFGRDRGAVSDYLYAGQIKQFLLYLGVLWLVAFANGFWFGRAIKYITVKHEDAVHGLDRIREECWFSAARWNLWLPWVFWYPFFHESIAPLYPWMARHPIVRVETTSHRIYYGRFMRYEKTTDGRLDAIRLANAQSYLPRKASRPCGRPAEKEETSPELIESGIPAHEIPSVVLGTLYLKWGQIADIVVMPKRGLPRAHPRIKPLPAVAAPTKPQVKDAEAGAPAAEGGT